MKLTEAQSRKIQDWLRKLRNTNQTVNSISEKLLEICRLGLSVYTVEKFLKIFNTYNRQNTISYIYDEMCEPLRIMFLEFKNDLEVSEVVVSSDEIENLCMTTSEKMMEASEFLKETIMEIESTSLRYRSN